MRAGTMSLVVVMLLTCLACQQAGDDEVAAAGTATATDALEPAVHEVTTMSPDGVAIVSDVRGAGDIALVFIHCWACNRSFWKGQLDHFADRYQVVAIDLPGHGESGCNRETWSVAGYGTDVQTVVEGLGLERVILIGHSMGGPVSLYAARLIPERVIGIVAADTLHNVELQPPAEQMAQIAESFEQDFTGTMTSMAAGAFAEDADPEVAAWVVEQAVAANPQVAVALFRDFANLDLPAALAAVEVPVRAINKAPQSEGDRATAIDINRSYGDFDAVLMEGVGHFLILERPDEFNSLLDQVLEELTGG